MIAINYTAAGVPCRMESAVAQIETMRAAPQRELLRIEAVLRGDGLTPPVRRVREASASQLRSVVSLYDGVIAILRGGVAAPAPPGLYPARSVARLEEALAAWLRLEAMRVGEPPHELTRAAAYVRETTAR